MSDYYNHGGYPAQSATGDSASARTEFDAIQTAMNKLPTITASGGRIVRVNAGATQLESVTPATATLELYADTQAGTHTLLGGVAGTNTITATAAPTLTAYTTGERFVFMAAAANTGAATLNVDGVGAISLVLPNGAALVANDILGANYPCHAIKRAADFVLLNPFVSSSVGLHSGVSKTPPVGADELSLWDSVSTSMQRLTVTNLLAYLTGLYAALGGSASQAFAASYVNAPIPQNSQSAAYTTVLGDANKHILHPVADNNARTFTIDSNANVAYPIGTTLTFVNEINTVTIAITTDTLIWAGSGTTGSRTLGVYGEATALKITATKWLLSGVGLS